MARAKSSDVVLETALGYRFKDRDLLERALTHISALAGSPSDGPHYQRLEFLGDRVLGLIVADMLYRTFPDESEGDLSRRLGALVRRETCAAVAREWQVASHLRVGMAEKRSGLRNREAILADVCEALIAAVWMDGGIEAARMVIEKAFAPRMDAAPHAVRDAKSLLQEWALGRGLKTPVYEAVERSGPDHKPVFRIEVVVDGFAAARGEGPSKRVAEQAAADVFLQREGIREQRS